MPLRIYARGQWLVIAESSYVEKRSHLTCICMSDLESSFSEHMKMARRFAFIISSTSAE
jgi:hypothetical protein